MQAWACAIGILGLSASILGSQFYYSKGVFRRSDECNLCYLHECMVLGKARCDYYVEAENILHTDKEETDRLNNPTVKREVDNLLFDLIDKAAGLSNLECIPYVSRYTDCNKENVCIGCKECSCDADGKWNCSSSHLCHTQDAPLQIDHRVLVMVMENLIDSGGLKKVKRSVTEIPDENQTDSSTITLEQMSEWLYGVKPLSKQDYSSTDSEVTDTTETGTHSSTTEVSTTESGPASVLTTTEIIVENLNMTDSDYVAFDEVLRSIAVDTKTYNRRKLPLDNQLNNNTFDVDYMLMDEDNMTAGENATDDISFLFNFMQENDGFTESTAEGATKIVIDLLEAASHDGRNFNRTQDYDIYNKDEDIATAFENTNDILEYNAINIMKRDVSSVTAPNITSTVTLIVNTTNTTATPEENTDLKNNVLTPLNNIIIEKRKELEKLNKIKENLLRHIKSGNEETEDIGSENNASNSYFSVYNLAIPSNNANVYQSQTGFDIDLRKANPNGLDKYMFKLKSDIYEVIKDIMGIQKLKSARLPDDLKSLIHAMKRYAYKNKINEVKTNKAKINNNFNTRRNMKQNFGRRDFISFKDCIVQILEVVDKDMPKSNALSPLSLSAKKILKHLIKTYYVDHFAVTGLRVHDPQYNLTNDLNVIGSKWQEMTANIFSSSPFVTLYRMKLLHFILTMDISKMNDALTLIDFAHSRRLLYALDKESDTILDRINAGLQAIHNKIQIIIRYYSKKPAKQLVSIRHRAQDTTDPMEDLLDSSKKKKRSFIKHIRTLLNSSKRDIAELLHRKVPKTEIVKQLARKKLDEISEKRYSEYEETMKKWQRNLDLAPRIKRSLLDIFKTRIKNIIPGYLRHKVNPRIKEKKKNTTAHDRKKKRKNHRTKKRTTAATKKTSEMITPKITRISTQTPATQLALTPVKH